MLGVKPGTPADLRVLGPLTVPSAPAFDNNGVLVRTSGAGTDQDVVEQASTVKQSDWYHWVGTTGLNRVGYGRAYIQEEWLAQLRDLKARHKAFRQMSENNGVAGGALRAIKMMVRRLAIQVDAKEDDEQGNQDAEFVKSVLNDMMHTWSATLLEALTMLEHGYSWLQMVAKVRNGANKSPLKASRHSDKLIGFAGWFPHSAEWNNGWIFAPGEDGGYLLGLRHLAPPDFHEVVIPRVKSLHFRVEQSLDNPEANSILRTAFRDWWYVQRLEEMEGIGLERTLAGLPVAWAPPEYFTSQHPQHIAVLNQLDGMVRGVRLDQRMGLVLPRSFDERGNQLFGFELMTATDGGRGQAMDMAIRRHEARIAGSVLADFMLLGQEGASAAFALSADKTALFLQALDTIAEAIAGEINDQAIPLLWRLNGWDPEEAPKVRFESAKRTNLTELGSFLNVLSTLTLPGIAGNAKLAKHLFKVADLPDLTDEDIEGSAGYQEQQSMRDMLMQSGFDPETGEPMTPTLQQQVDQGDLATQQQAQAVDQGHLSTAQQEQAVQQGDMSLKQQAEEAKAAKEGKQPPAQEEPAPQAKAPTLNIKVQTGPNQSPSKSKAKGGAGQGGSADRPQRPTRARRS